MILCIFTLPAPLSLFCISGLWWKKLMVEVAVLLSFRTLRSRGGGGAKTLDTARRFYHWTPLGGAIALPIHTHGYLKLFYIALHPLL